MKIFTEHLFIIQTGLPVSRLYFNAKKKVLEQGCEWGGGGGGGGSASL